MRLDHLLSKRKGKIEGCFNLPLSCDKYDVIRKYDRLEVHKTNLYSFTFRSSFLPLFLCEGPVAQLVRALL